MYSTCVCVCTISFFVSPFYLPLCSLSLSLPLYISPTFCSHFLPNFSSLSFYVPYNVV